MQTDLFASAAHALPSLAAPASTASTTGLGPGSTSGSTSANTPFAAVLGDAMSSLRGLEAQASSASQGLLEGRQVDIHAAMIATQKAGLAFEMALAVRGKVVSAYQSLMGVQF